MEVLRLQSSDQISGETADVFSKGLKYILRLPAIIENNQHQEYLFRNHKDGCMQSITANGQNFIIINAPTLLDAWRLDFLERMADIKGLTGLARPRFVMNGAEQYMGYNDRYDSNAVYEALSLTDPVLPGNPDVPPNLKQRNGEVVQAIYVPRPVIVEDPDRGPQIGMNGAVLIRDSQELRLVQPHIAEETYYFVNEDKLKVDSLPVWAS